MLDTLLSSLHAWNLMDSLEGRYPQSHFKDGATKTQKREVT